MIYIVFGQYLLTLITKEKLYTQEQKKSLQH